MGEVVGVHGVVWMRDASKLGTRVLHQQGKFWDIKTQIIQNTNIKDIPRISLLKGKFAFSRNANLPFWFWAIFKTQIFQNTNFKTQIDPAKHKFQNTNLCFATKRKSAFSNRKFVFSKTEFAFTKADLCFQKANLRFTGKNKFAFWNLCFVEQICVFNHDWFVFENRNLLFKRQISVLRNLCFDIFICVLKSYLFWGKSVFWKNKFVF